MEHTVLTQRLRDLLTASGVTVPEDAGDKLRRFCALLREWNDVASLVSRGDLPRLETVHVPDALSLAPYVLRHAGAAGLLDIGSGGGFPAVPLAVVLPRLPVTLVERTAKKAGFLRKVCAALPLPHARVVLGTFPGAVAGHAADVLTARAVENPAGLQPAFAERIAGGAVFLCQSGLTWNHDGERFHVEHVDDLWKTAGLRRGALHIVRHEDYPGSATER